MHYSFFIIISKKYVIFQSFSGSKMGSGTVYFRDLEAEMILKSIPGTGRVINIIKEKNLT